MFVIDDVLKILFKSYVDGRFDEKKIAAREFIKLYDSFDRCLQLAPEWIAEDDIDYEIPPKEYYSLEVVKLNQVFLDLARPLEIYDPELFHYILMGGKVRDWMLDKDRRDTLLDDIGLIKACLADFIKKNFNIEDLFSR